MAQRRVSRLLQLLFTATATLLQLLLLLLQLQNIQAMRLQARQTSRAAYRDIWDLPSNRWRMSLSGSIMRGLCETCFLPFAGHRRGLYVGGRTVSAATTVADAIGDLAALYQHVVERGRVLGLVFCHSEVLLDHRQTLFVRFRQCRRSG